MPPFELRVSDEKGEGAEYRFWAADMTEALQLAPLILRNFGHGREQISVLVDQLVAEADMDDCIAPVVMQNFREKLIRRELHARRWGKLVQLARIRIIGSAGWPTHHMGVEFWHEYPNAPTRREDLEVFTDFVDRTPPTKEAT